MAADRNSHHRDTLEKLFTHPSSGNIEWRQVLSAAGGCQDDDRRAQRQGQSHARLRDRGPPAAGRQGHRSADDRGPAADADGGWPRAGLAAPFLPAWTCVAEDVRAATCRSIEARSAFRVGCVVSGVFVWSPGSRGRRCGCRAMRYLLHRFDYDDKDRDLVGERAERLDDPGPRELNRVRYQVSGATSPKLVMSCPDGPAASATACALKACQWVLRKLEMPSPAAPNANRTLGSARQRRCAARDGGEQRGRRGCRWDRLFSSRPMIEPGFLSVFCPAAGSSCRGAVEVLDEPGHPGWGLGKLVDVGPAGQRATIGVPQLPGDDAGRLLGRRHG